MKDTDNERKGRNTLFAGDEDVEGHMPRIGRGLVEDDTEGHMPRLPNRVVEDEDGEDDDTEGHGVRVRI